MEFSGVTKSFASTDDNKVEQTLELLDEYWFFENLFHRRPCMFMSTTDLWNSIQKMGTESQDAKKSLFSPTNTIKEDDLVCNNLLRTPSLPPSIGREKAVREKEVIQRSSSKLTRQTSLSSSKVVPLLRDSEVLYYNQQYSSDSLYHTSNNSKEMVFEKKGASGSSTPINSSRESSPVHHSLHRSSKLTRQASLSSSKVVPQLRGAEVQYYNQQPAFDPLYNSLNNIQEMGASGSSTPINSSKESSPVHHHNLLRTPSLPSPREETEFLRKSSKLTRQASLRSSDISPPVHIPKAGLLPTTRSPAIPRHRTRKEPKIESLMKDNQPCPTNKEVIRRSLSYKRSSSTKIDLEVEEVQGFKDLGFVFDKEEINKSLATIIPGLQEKKQIENENDDDEKNKARRPYLSEAWLVQPSKPAVPNWVDRRSSGDMKEQLKFWARTVASNVRQEC